MQERLNDTKLVSVLVPCYNAGNLVLETLQSILSQEGIDLELIFVDDGSTDDTKAKVLSLNDTRLQYIYQHNKGVSAARNKALEHAKGKYIVFFDADDKMSRDFLKSRVDYLEKHITCDFVCGRVQKFNDKGIVEGYFRGTSSDVIAEILLYDPEVTSCPSNYMFRSSFLEKYGLRFNTRLSSTADKYFLVRCAWHGTCDFSEEAGKLFYRILENSMSHNLTKKLVADNEQYYLELTANYLVPSALRNRALFAGYFILSASFWKLSERRQALRYAVKSFIHKPLLFIKRSLS